MIKSRLLPARGRGIGHAIALRLQSSKGPAAEYVFITHFDDQYFIKDKNKTNISDQDICNFLVAITRDRGTAEKVAGKVQNKVGDVKKVFGK
jgi:hypothetical protein